MSKKQKISSSFLNMVLVLTLISIVSALALGYTYSITKDAIARVRTDRIKKAIKEVLPPDFNNKPYEEKYPVPGFEEVIIYPAKKDGKIIGNAVKSFSDSGFNERIWVIVGFDVNRKIYNISGIEHKETPGLGSRLKGEKFLKQFRNQDPATFILLPTKEKGDVDAITAATISSRAFCEAVDKAYKALGKGEKE